MKKLLSVLFASLFALVSFAPSAFADPGKGKTVLAKAAKVNESNEPGQVIADAMWVAGGKRYQAEVVYLAKKYNAKMDRNCQVKDFFDVSVAAKKYRFIPFVADAVRDKVILKQVATMGCEMSPYIQNEDKVAAIQKIWRM